MRKSRRTASSNRTRAFRFRGERFTKRNYVGLVQVLECHLMAPGPPDEGTGDRLLLGAESCLHILQHERCFRKD